MKKIIVAFVSIFLIINLFGVIVTSDKLREKNILVEKKDSYNEFYKNSYNSIIVKFKSGIGEKIVKKLLTRYGASSFSKSSHSDFYKIRIPNFLNNIDIVDFYNNNDFIEYAEPDYLVHACMTPNDPYFSYQWHLQGFDEGGIDMESAWDISTGAGAVVAVLDTGIRVGTELSDTCFVPGYDFINNDNDPVDDHGHGTHCAGTIAQSTNNNIGVSGVAFDACLMAVKVLDSSGSGYYSDIADGIYYAVDNGADVISMSLSGGSGSTTLEDALEYAYNNGVTCVAAAGNNGASSVSYPAAYDDYVIAVGATQYDKNRAPYSNYGNGLDIVAPGGNLDLDQNNDGYGDGVLQQTFNYYWYVQWGYYFYQGTSMACPHVAGTAALLYSLGVNNPDDVRYYLEYSAIDLGPSGWDDEFGHGLLNAYNAVSAVSNGDPPIADAGPDQTTNEGTQITLDATSSNDPDGTITNYQWDLGDGNTATGPTPTHTYTDNAVYTVTLTVTDNDLQTDTDTTTITVNNQPPTADTNGPYNKPEGDNIQMNAIITDPGTEDTHTCTWDLGDGNTKTGNTINHIYTDNGIFTITLTITDDDGASTTTTTTADIQNINPTANTNGPYNGQEGQTIIFTGTMTDPGTEDTHTYTWDFGDGNTGTGQTTDHIYLDEGTYTLTLTVTDDDGGNGIDSSVVDVYDIDPVCSFSYSPDVIVEGDQVYFNDESSSYDGINSWYWVFDDGSSSTDQNPIHTYSSSGDYNVILTIDESDGDSHSYQELISVLDNVVPPIADAGPDQTTNEGTQITLDATSSNDPDGTITNYQWDLGDGNTATGPTPTHTYTDNAVYTVTLTVTDNDLQTDTDTTTITVNNQPPTADTNGPYNKPEGDNIQMNAIITDPGTEDTHTCTWDLGDGNTKTGNTINHIYTDNGIFTITLTITDDDGASTTTTTTADIQNINPTANTNGPYNGQEGQTIIFTGTMTDPGTEDTHTYTWDFGDGNTGTGQTTDHIYLDEGTYTLTLTVTDDDGGTDIDTTTVTVDPVQDTNTMHVSDISLSIESNWWGLIKRAVVTIEILDQNNDPVYNSDVSGIWTGLTSENENGYTNSQGKIVFYSNWVWRPSGSFVFTVTDVQKTDYVYDLESNIETSDSISV